MPIIPRANPGDVTRINPLPGVRNNTQVSAGPGIDLARAIGGAGEVANKFYEKKVEENNMAALMGARRQFDDWENAQFDPSNPEGIEKYKGKDSLRAETDLVPAARQQIEVIGSSLTPMQRQRWNEIGFNAESQFSGRVQRTAYQNHETFQKFERKSAIDSLSNSAATAIGSNDPLTYTPKVDEAAALYENQLKMDLGKDTDVSEAVRQYKSGLYTTGIDAALSAQDVDGATALIDRHSAEMSVDDRMRVQKAIQPFRNSREDMAVVGGVLAGGSGSATGSKIPYSETRDYVAKITANAGQVTGTNDQKVEQLWPHLTRQESGGKQSAVSVKGARGVAQLMPATARDLERQLGMQPGETDTSAEANARAGKFYLKQQLDRFGGDPVMALAAYNAGPGAVEKWRNSGVFSETATAAPPATLSDAIARVRAVSAGDPETTNRRIALVTRSFAEKDQRERDTLESITTKVENSAPGADLHTFLSPAEIQALTDSGKLDAVKNRQTQRFNGALPQDNPQYLESLRQLKLHDPVAYSKLDPNDPAVAANLSTATRLDLQQEVATMRAGGKKASQAQEDWMSEGERINSGFATLGIAPTPGKPAVNQDKRDAFAFQYRLGLRKLIENKEGKKPTPQELDTLLSTTAQQFALKPDKATLAANAYVSANKDFVQMDNGVRYSGQDIADAQARLRAQNLPSTPNDAVRTLMKMNMGKVSAD